MSKNVSYALAIGGGTPTMRYLKKKLDRLKNLK
jgi:hypothetical protein